MAGSWSASDLQEDKSRGPGESDDVGRARPKNVLAGFLLMLAAVQAGTGVLLLWHYQPDAAQAFGSVRKLVEQVPLGWFMRSLHAWSASMMMAALLAHMLLALVSGSVIGERRGCWWTGLGLLVVTSALGLTGSMLPWDSLAQQAHAVTLGLIDAATPGPMPRVHWQGPSKAFALHVGLLPLLLLLLMSAHRRLTRQASALAVESDGPSAAPGSMRTRLVASWLLGGNALVAVAALAPPPIEAPDVQHGPSWYLGAVYGLMKIMPARIGAVDSPVVGVAIVALGGLVLAALPLVVEKARPHQRRALTRALACGAAASWLVLSLSGWIGR